MRLYADNGYYSRRGTRGRLRGGIAGPGLPGLRGLGACTFYTPTAGWQFCAGTDQACINANCPGTPLATGPSTACAGTLDAYGDCVTDPTNPIAAIIAQAQEGKITPAQAQALIAQTVQEYCALNAQNVNTFGDPADPGCASGQLPTGVNNVTATPQGTLSQPSILTSVAPTPYTPPLPVTQPLNPLKPPPTGNPLAGTTPPAGNGLNPGNTTQGGGTPAPAATETCGGIGYGPCVGPLDAGTWGLIAVAAVVVLMMAKK